MICNRDLLVKRYKEIQNLITVDFSTNKFTLETNIITSIDPNTFKGLSKITSVSFNGNQITKLESNLIKNINYSLMASLSTSSFFVLTLIKVKVAIVGSCDFSG